jgi:hypothetical protein
MRVQETFSRVLEPSAESRYDVPTPILISRIFFHPAPGRTSVLTMQLGTKLECHLVIKELGFNSVTGCVLRFVKHEAESIMPMSMGMALMTILMTVGLSDAISFDSSWSPSDRWHIAGTPSVISQEVQFANARAI